MTKCQEAIPFDHGRTQSLSFAPTSIDAAFISTRLMSVLTKHSLKPATKATRNNPANPFSSRIVSTSTSLKATSAKPATIGVFAQPQGNELIPLANDDYPFYDHVEDVLRRQSRRSGMLLNSDELIARLGRTALT